MICSILDKNLSKEARRAVYAMAYGLTEPKDNGTQTPCQLWTGRTLNGVGILDFSRKHIRIRLYARRYSYEMNIGPIPPRKLIKTTCGERLCIEPKHLVVAGKDVEPLRCSPFAHK